MGELEAGDKHGPSAPSPLGRDRSCEPPHASAGRRRRAVRALSRLARRLLQTLRGGRRREGAEPEDDDGGFRRPKPPGPDRDQAAGGGGGGGAQFPWGVPTPTPTPTPAPVPLPAVSPGGEPPRPLTPGAQGLKNHGNTCFLNAVVQCLSHTELLAAFLLLALPDQQAPGPGSGTASGEVTQHLAALVRALWTLEYTPQLSANFKVGRGWKGSGRADLAAAKQEGLIIIIIISSAWTFPDLHSSSSLVSLNFTSQGSARIRPTGNRRSL